MFLNKGVNMLYGCVSHNQEILKRLNDAIGTNDVQSIFMDLCESYFDNDDLANIAEFIMERYPIMQQATFHMNVFVTLDGKNIESHKDAIMDELQGKINSAVSSLSSDMVNVVETEVSYSDNTSAMVITNI